MHVFSKEQVSAPIDNGYGEFVYELLGSDFAEKTEIHSVAHILISPQKSSRLHIHPVAEESYYILSGKAQIHVGEEQAEVSPGQVILIPPGKVHQIKNVGEEPLEFLAICVPAWEPGNTEFLD
jgi:mannose-6-phosphate isomerase-like protein (cupin superfamily)